MKLSGIVMGAFFIVTCSQGAYSQASPSEPVTLLYMQSEPGDFIGGGGTYRYNKQNGNFTAEAIDVNQNGQIDFVIITFQGATDWWRLQFTAGRGFPPLTKGIYPKAQRAPFVFFEGYAGLDVSGNGSGCSQLSGSFAVLKAEFDAQNTFHFAAEFEQQCGKGALKGVVYFNYVPTVSARILSNAVNAGDVAKGTIILDTPAPDGGALIDILGSRPDVANVPATVFIPGGSRSGTFSVPTQIVKFDTTVNILAIYGGTGSLCHFQVISPLPLLNSFHLREKSYDSRPPTESLVTLRNGVFRNQPSVGLGNFIYGDQITITPNDNGSSFTIDLTTGKKSIPLIPGSYQGAQRYQYDHETDRPQFTLFSPFTICPPSETDFTILDVDCTLVPVNFFGTLSFSPILNGLALDFEQRCENTISATGSLYFNYTPPSACRLSFTPIRQSFSAAGGSASVSVKQTTDCSWSAESEVPWITIQIGSSSREVAYLVDANTSGQPRTGTIKIGELSYSIVQASEFSDVSAGHPYYFHIGKIAARGITLGCAPGMFCPDVPVTREQMAAFIIRALGETAPFPSGLQRFADVPETINGQLNPFGDFIDRLAGHGITAGCGSNEQGQGLYCPRQFVTRAQMAAFIIRALGEYRPPQPPFQRFSDVSQNDPFYAFIDQIAARAIANGCGVRLFCPNEFVTRGQMAFFLVRAFGL